MESLRDFIEAVNQAPEKGGMPASSAEIESD
jgi:hypothetical protein